MRRVPGRSDRAGVGDPGRRARRSDIQGLRGLAVLLVVLFHAGVSVPGGFTGVDVFFAISGFVITAMLLSELTSTGGIRLSRFYARRVKRLAPALAVMLVVVAVLGVLAAPVGGQEVGARTGVFASLFSANAYLSRLPTGYFDPVATLNPFLHTWTLAVEEQFYVFFPTLLLIAWWLGRRTSFLRGHSRLVAIAAVSVTTVVSFVLALGLSRSVQSSRQEFAFYSSPTRAWEFGAGALLALLAPWLVRLPRLVAQGLGALGLAAIVTAAFAIHDMGGFQVTATLLPVLGTCAVIGAGSDATGVTGRVLGTRPVVWIGDLSYSWYLWHWPLIVFAAALWPGTGWTAPTFAGVSLLPAWLSYRYIENPIRFNPRISGRAVLGIGAACIALPVAACVGLLGTRHVLARTDALQDYQESQLPHAVQYSCATTTLACGRGHPQRTVVLIGDSNAGQFAEPVLRAANRAGFQVTLISSGGCPFADLRVVRRNRPLPRQEMAACRRFYVQSLRAVVRLEPDLVITAERTDRYVADTTFGLGGPGGGPITYTASRKGPLWSQGLGATLRVLNAARIPVVVVQPVPVVQAISVSECAAVRILASSCTASATRGAVARYLKSSVAADDRAVAAAPGPVSTIDFTDQLCGPARCTTREGDVVLYLDRYHLSVAGSLQLTGTFYRVLVSRIRR